jgi:alkaline phosphatase
MALLSNYSRDFAVADESGAATTLATGRKANNRNAGAKTSGTAASIIDLARQKGRTIGLVTNTSLTNLTVAAFYATGQSRTDEIARDFAEQKKIDIAFGGGSAEFLPESKGGLRRDGRDLILELRRDGFEIVRTKAELENVPRWRRPRLLGLFSSAQMASAKQVASGSEQPSLSDMTRRAIELLQWNPGGYLLIVDAGLMGVAARANDGEQTLLETVELDRAIAVAKSYTGENSTILACGNLGIGGLTLNGSPFRRDSGIAVLGVNAAGEPALTRATGPNGPRDSQNHLATEAGGQDPAGTEKIASATARFEPAASFAPTARTTVTDVLAVGRGPGSERLHGFLDNSAIFQIMQDQL